MKQTALGPLSIENTEGGKKRPFVQFENEWFIFLPKDKSLSSPFEPLLDNKSYFELTRNGIRQYGHFVS